MEAPKKVRVAYEDTDFGHQGRLSDGRLFIAFVTGTAPKGQSWVDRIIAVLHLFDTDSNHLETKSRLCGFCQNLSTYRADRDRAEVASSQILGEILTELAQFHPENCPIDVKLFGQVVDNIEYGFYYRPDVDEDETIPWVIHMPRNHWYYPPWNTGGYDT